MKAYTIRFVFDRKHVASKTRKGLVQMEVTIDRKRKLTSTGVRVYSDQWNDRKMVVRHPDMIVLNRRLLECQRDMQDKIAAMQKSGEVIDVAALSDKSHEQTENVFDLIRTSIEENTENVESTRKAKRAMLHTVESFEGIRLISDLTLANIERLDAWMRQKGLSSGTIVMYHAFLSSQIRILIKKGLVEKNPYDLFAKPKHSKGTRHYLSADKLHELENAHFKIARQEEARDLFLFQCYTGMAYVDMCRFDFKKVEKRGDKFVYLGVRQKTHVNFYIVLVSQAIDILRKYNFVLPSFEYVQAYDVNLASISRKMGWDKKITSHIGRHTFAVTALNKGVRIEVLARMMGHTDIKTTQIYAKIVNSEVERGFELLER